MKYITMSLVLLLLGSASCFASGHETVMFVQRDSHGKLTCRLVRTTFAVTRDKKTSSAIMTVYAPDCIVSNQAQQVIIRFTNADVMQVNIPDIHNQSTKKALSFPADTFSVSIPKNVKVLFNNNTVQARLLESCVTKVKDAPVVVRKPIPESQRLYIKDIDQDKSSVRGKPRR